jgi:hypothetical protein
MDGFVEDDDDFGGFAPLVVDPLPVLPFDALEFSMD